MVVRSMRRRMVLCVFVLCDMQESAYFCNCARRHICICAHIYAYVYSMSLNL